MAALRRENLVKDGKYNRAEIMKRAWAYVKNPFNTEYRNDFKAALRAAWVDAKLVMDEAVAEESRTNRPIFPNKGLGVADFYNTVNMRMGYACR